jgi:hypothetical protein
MTSLDKAARIAAWLVVVAMLVHSLNALYLEPTYLGFVDKARDYGDMAKIENALWSFSFISSGTAHVVCGFALMILGLGLNHRFRERHEVAATLLLLAAVLSGLGFLMTGISDLPGAMYAQILRGINPAYNTEILLIATMIRSVCNVLAIVGLSWLAGQLAWLTQRTGDFPRWFGWYGWLLVLPGLVSFPFPPAGFIYIQLTVIWAAALGVYLGRPTRD